MQIPIGAAAHKDTLFADEFLRLNFAIKIGTTTIFDKMPVANKTWFIIILSHVLFLNGFPLNFHKIIVFPFLDKNNFRLGQNESDKLTRFPQHFQFWLTLKKFFCFTSDGELYY